MRIEILASARDDVNASAKHRHALDFDIETQEAARQRLRGRASIRRNSASYTSFISRNFSAVRFEEINPAAHHVGQGGAARAQNVL